MCGSGALSFALQSCGVQIRATDNYSWEGQNAMWFQQPWIEIEKIDCVEAIQKYGVETEILICSWPYTDDSCCKALLAMRKINPNMKMIYIGEKNEAVTASEDFFGSIEEIDDPSFYNTIKNFRSAYCLHDRPLLLK